MLLTTLATTDKVFRYHQCIVIPFTGLRRVLSTARYNGGLRDDITAIFNHDCTQGRGMPCKLLAPTYGEHIGKMGCYLGFDPKTVTGMCTAASMENVAIVSENYLELTVTAIVTGGVDENGGRVGDPAKYYEPLMDNAVYKHGTINIILVINADLPPGTITRALVICSEAKAAALQELAAGSNYSTGIATGSGTDETIIVANPESALTLEDAGKHSKLGELIGKSVKEAVKKALFYQTGLSPQRQHDILWRMKRFGVTDESLWSVYQQGTTVKYNKPEFITALADIKKDDTLVSYTALIAHVQDEYNWGLLSYGMFHLLLQRRRMTIGWIVTRPLLLPLYANILIK